MEALVAGQPAANKQPFCPLTMLVEDEKNIACLRFASNIKLERVWDIYLNLFLT
jgi:hypothetical protein